MFKYSLALVTALAAVGACNNDRTQSAANNAAERAADRAEELAAESRDLRDTARDESAELSGKMTDNREELKDDLKGVADNLRERADETVNQAADGVEKIGEETDDVTAKAGAMANADSEFQVQKSIRIATLRGIHAIAASQPMLINLVNDNVSFIAEDQAVINEKVNTLMSRLGEASNQISGLEAVDARSWEERERAAAEAMNRLEDARSDAFEALSDARRVDDRTSMR